MKSWIFIAVLALAICACGLLTAQEQGSESPATSASIEQGGAAKEGAVPPAGVPPAKGGAEAPSSPSTSAEPSGSTSAPSGAGESAAPAVPPAGGK